MTTYHFTGPTTRRIRGGSCPGCGRKVTRSRTFEHTVNPFNRHPTEDRPKTWEEVRADLKIEADAWQPNFTCRACKDSAELDRATLDDLLRWIGAEANERYELRRSSKYSRADLCNQRIAVYVARVLELDPDRTDWPTSCYYDSDDHDLRYCCFYEFPDQQRCVYGARHGTGYHLSPAGERVAVGASGVR